MRFQLRQLVLVATAGVLIACYSSPETPPPSTTPTPTPTAATVTSVTVGGGGSGTVGQTSQLSATAQMSDGTSLQVTGQATWESTSASVATVSVTGLVMFVGAGEADLKATYRSVTGTARVAVSERPKPKYRLSGTVTESTTGRIVAQSVIRVQDGTDAGRSVESDVAGKYTFDALTEGTFTLKVTHSGYEDNTRLVTLSSDGQADLTLKPLLDVSASYGTFNVSLSVLSGNCEFPPAPGSSGTVRLAGREDGSEVTFVITERGTTRDYSGSMEPNGSFSARGSGVFAGLLPTNGPSVLEFLHDFTGVVNGTVSGRTISGVENITFGIPCPGQTMRLSFHGSK